jgi:hypothetical protein
MILVVLCNEIHKTNYFHLTLNADYTMGKGTTAMDSVPPKKLLYGNSDFYLRPIYQGHNKKGQDTFFFSLRPSQTEGYLFELEGEFGIGEHSIATERKEIKEGYYKNTKYVYYQEDVKYMSEEQKDAILEWAADGEL